MRLYLASVTDYRLWGGQNGIVSCRINGLISLQWQQHYTWQQYADHSSTHTQEMKLFLAGEHGTKNGLQREREREVGKTFQSWRATTMREKIRSLSDFIIRALICY